VEINAAKKNQKGEGPTPSINILTTRFMAEIFWANQPPRETDVRGGAGGLSIWLDRMGVMFNRTPEGLLDYRRFRGNSVSTARRFCRSDDGGSNYCTRSTSKCGGMSPKAKSKNSRVLRFLFRGD